jgi:hypothetical protein
VSPRTKIIRKALKSLGLLLIVLIVDVLRDPGVLGANQNAQYTVASHNAVEEAMWTNLQRPDDGRDLEVARGLMLAVDLGPVLTNEATQEGVERALLGHRDGADAAHCPGWHLRERTQRRVPLVEAVVQIREPDEVCGARVAPVAAAARGAVRTVTSELSIECLHGRGTSSLGSVSTTPLYVYCMTDLVCDVDTAYEDEALRQLRLFRIALGDWCSVGRFDDLEVIFLGDDGVEQRHIEEVIGRRGGRHLVDKRANLKIWLKDTLTWRDLRAGTEVFEKRSGVETSKERPGTRRRWVLTILEHARFTSVCSG